MKKNLYEELGLTKMQPKVRLNLHIVIWIKQHHPDAGGKKERFLAIQNAWETLNDPIKKEKYDKNFFSSSSSLDSLNENWEVKFNPKKCNSSIKDKEVEEWIKEIYTPINRLINQIIKPLNNEIKELSADPYDDQLMENFCSYISFSQKKIEKVEKIYNKKLVPKSISDLGLNLYHCFSQVKDALSEFDRYTQGYVDDYLFDGKEMIREAKRIQLKMASEKKIKIFRLKILLNIFFKLI